MLLFEIYVSELQSERFVCVCECKFKYECNSQSAKAHGAQSLRILGHQDTWKGISVIEEIRYYC